MDLKPFLSNCLFLTAKNFAGVHTTLFVLLAFVGVGYMCVVTRSQHEFSNAFKLICIMLITLLTKHICTNTDTCVRATCCCAVRRRCVIVQCPEGVLLCSAQKVCYCAVRRRCVIVQCTEGVLLCSAQKVCYCAVRRRCVCVLNSSPKHLRLF